MAVQSATEPATPPRLTHHISSPTKHLDDHSKARELPMVCDTLELEPAPKTPKRDLFGPVQVAAMPMFRGSRHAVTMSRFAQNNIPYFFLREEGPFATPLSGLLSPRQGSTEAVESDGEEAAGFNATDQADTQAFARLNGALKLRQSRGIVVMHLRDAHFERYTHVLPWQDLAHDPQACALLDCLLRLSPHTPWHMSDSELLCNTLAAACFMTGCMVRRDFEMAERLMARVPTEARGRALALTQTYAAQHDLWSLQAYLEPEAELFGAFEQGPAWQQPWRWPGLVKATALWLLDLTFSDQE